MEWSWLLVLVCPLMMIFMMFGMKGSHSHGHGQASHSSIDLGVEQQLSELREQNEQLRKEVDKLSRNSR